MNIRVQIRQKNDSEMLPHDLLNTLSNDLDNGTIGDYNVSPNLDMVLLETMIKDKYKDKVSIRHGCMQGVYGSNTGNYDEGITLYFSLELFPERFIDNDGDEIVNLWHSLNENGTLIKQICDSVEDRYIKMYSDSIDVTHDNTYNYEGNGNSAYALSHVDFKVIEASERVLVFASFHNGGDVRGNYGDPFIFEFNDRYDAINSLSLFNVLKD